MRYNKFASRKFILSLVVMGISTFLLCFNFLTGDEFIKLVGLAVGAFVGGNVLSKFAYKGYTNVGED